VGGGLTLQVQKFFVLAAAASRVTTDPGSWPQVRLALGTQINCLPTKQRLVVTQVTSHKLMRLLATGAL